MEPDLYAEQLCPRCGAKILKVASFCPHCGWERKTGWWDRLWGGSQAEPAEDQPTVSLGLLLPLLIGLGIALLVIFQVVKGGDLEIILTLLGILFLVWRGWGIARTRAEKSMEEDSEGSDVPGGSSPPGDSASTRYFCDNCGSAVEPDASYCPSCGLKFGPPPSA